MIRINERKKDTIRDQKASNGASLGGANNGNKNGEYVVGKMIVSGVAVEEDDAVVVAVVVAVVGAEVGNTAGILTIEAPCATLTTVIFDNANVNKALNGFC